jgi:hypothetical protein|tara:strand:- start:2455 stop:2748 length:294 start_codon:yes stop_codon:yes gene_type:complete
MKTNVSINLNDDERNHLGNIFHNKKSAKLITRKELNTLVQLMVNELLNQDVGDFKEVTGNIAEEGYKYYFNDVRVTAEEWESGIHAWLEKRARRISV